jgi:hypothetical protein
MQNLDDEFFNEYGELPGISTVNKLRNRMLGAPVHDEINDADLLSSYENIEIAPNRNAMAPLVLQPPGAKMKFRP